MERKEQGREGGVIAEGLKYGHSGTKKEAKLRGDSQTRLSYRCQPPGSCNEVIKWV